MTMHCSDDRAAHLLLATDGEHAHEHTSEKREQTTKFHAYLSKSPAKMGTCEKCRKSKSTFNDKFTLLFKTVLRSTEAEKAQK